MAFLAQEKKFCPDKKYFDKADGRSISLNSLDRQCMSEQCVLSSFIKVPMKITYFDSLKTLFVFFDILSSVFPIFLVKNITCEIVLKEGHFYKTSQRLWKETFKNPTNVYWECAIVKSQ